MTDNRNLAALTGNGAADEVSYSGDTALVQLMKPVRVSGAEGSKVVIEPGYSTSATLANVAGSVSSVTLQAANVNRLGLIIVNDSSATLYVKYGTTASATSFTYLLMAGESLRETMYTGLVTGIWASATGVARMTELTP